MKENTKETVMLIGHLIGLVMFLIINPIVCYKFGHDLLFTLLIGLPGGLLFLGTFIYAGVLGWFDEIIKLERGKQERW